jgi:hypothetical protein
LAGGIGADSAGLVAQVAGDLPDHSDYSDQHNEDERHEDATNEDRFHHYTAQCREVLPLPRDYNERYALMVPLAAPSTLPGLASAQFAVSPGGPPAGAHRR